VPITALLENCDRWHMFDRDIADKRDGQMNSMAVLRRDLVCCSTGLVCVASDSIKDELFRKIRYTCDNYRTTDNGLEVAQS
jgi:hypothetical protein